MPEPVLPPYVVPDGIEPFVAYRTWFIEDGENGLRLCSCTSPYELWEPRRAFKASCRYDFSECEIVSVNRDCFCGIYARNAYDAAFVDPITGASGEVYLWGRILEGEKGYRAEYAYPKSLVVHDPKIVKELSHVYGVPVESRAPYSSCWGETLDHLREFGTVPTTNMIQTQRELLELKARKWNFITLCLMMSAMALFIVGLIGTLLGH